MLYKLQINVETRIFILLYTVSAFECMFKRLVDYGVRSVVWHATVLKIAVDEVLPRILQAALIRIVTIEVLKYRLLI